MNTVTNPRNILIHQVVHVAGGEALGLHTVLDVTHHMLALAGVVAAHQWRKASA